MNDTITKTHLFLNMKFDLKGHTRLKIRFFLNIFFVFLILSKIYMNVNIMNTQIFHKIEYDLKGHSRSLKALSTKFVLAHSSIH